MVAAIFNDDVDFSTFFDDLKDIEDPLIDDNLDDLLPDFWTEAVEEEPSSKFDNRSVSDFALQDTLITEGGTDVNKIRLSAGNQLRSFSPVSVLGSNTSGCGLAADFAKTVRSGIPVQVRARTKRGRPPSGRQMVPASWTWTSSLDVTRKSFMERKRKTKKSKVSFVSKMDQNEYKKPNDTPFELGIERKCTHCDITVTPQWRLGPMGPKTLCNACGVRYKSGRLFPEYRPAASPTFSPSKHSNSHRKVLEMRKKDGKNAPAIDMVKNVKGEENHLVPVSVELISDGFNWS